MPGQRHRAPFSTDADEEVDLARDMGSTGPPRPPQGLQVGSPADGADLLEFSETAAVTVLNYLCVVIVEADRATRSLGEERMKGTKAIDKPLASVNMMVRNKRRDEQEGEERNRRGRWRSLVFHGASQNNKSGLSC